MKSKNGQIFVLALLVMAIGLIIISPMLHYLDNSQERYIIAIKRTNAYYTADAMMTYILNDVARGVDIYNNNISTAYSADGYMSSEYDIDVYVEESPTTGPLPTPAGGGTGWIYMDPGYASCNTSTCNESLFLENLAYGATHQFPFYVVGGSTIEANWCFDDESLNCAWDYGFKCAYYCKGSMWMAYENGSTIPGTFVNGSNTSQPLRLQTNYSVPEGASMNYSVFFRNDNSYRVQVTAGGWICDCTGGNQDRAAYSEPFVATDNTSFTWVRIGDEEGGDTYNYKDYLVTATASRDGEDIVTITAYFRHSPGPSARWKPQTVVIPTWAVTYY